MYIDILVNYKNKWYPIELKYKTKKGLYWSAANNFASRGIQFVFGIILARLLSPDRTIYHIQ